MPCATARVTTSGWGAPPLSTARSENAADSPAAMNTRDCEVWISTFGLLAPLPRIGCASVTGAFG